MDKDSLLQLTILESLEKEFGISHLPGFSVNVRDGVATLTGEVGSYAIQREIRDSVMSIPGVNAVVQEIQVKIPESSMMLDDQIAKSVVEALDANEAVPLGRVKAIIKDGAVILEGEVDQHHQKEEAESTVARISSVMGITNNIKVLIPVSPLDIKRRIVDSWKTMIIHHAENINVEMKDGKVILSGMVYAWVEKFQAENAVKEMLGNNVQVENRIELTPLLRGKEDI